MKLISNRLLWAVLALAWMSVGRAAGQTSTSDPARELDKVQITGSRLSRTDTETPSPVQVITREEIARSGAVSVTEVMQWLPASNGFNTSANEPRGHGAGSVSLRGLGASATLVLINGRRVAPAGFADAFGAPTFVDLNQIPMGIVERIEVLLDGASAVYGSDAVAGVVNIILRRDYHGFAVEAALGRSTHGDGLQSQASVTLGLGDLSTDRYNLIASVSHQDQDAVTNEARWHSRSADYRGFGLADLRTAYSYPGNLFTADNRTFLQPLAGCNTIGEPGSANAGRCASRPVRDLVPESRRDALFVAGTAALSRGFELFGDATVGRSVVNPRNLSLAGSSYSANGISPLGLFLLPVGHSQNPYPFEVAVRTRFADEPRFQTATIDTQRVVLGLRHPNLSDWDVEAGLLWSRSKAQVVQTGVINEAVLRNEVFDARGRAVPGFRFGDPAANDPALMARLYPRLVEAGRTSTASVDLRGTREVLRLPGGPVQLAIGGELRQERFSTAADPRVVSREVTTLFQSTATGSRTIGSTYAELALPLTRTLEASLAGRYDHYSDFGGTANSKAGVKWKVLPSVAVRATFATAFRAPSPLETGGAPATLAAQVRRHLST